MNDKLDALSDQQLSEVFAVEVAGLREVPESEYGAPGFWEQIMGPRALVTSGRFTLPPFATDANAVLPWLENHANPLCEWRGGVWSVYLFTMGDAPKASAPTFARAATLTLLRAKRAGKAAS